MRAAPAEREFLNRRTADTAGLPFAVVDKEMFLMMAVAALAVAVIAKRRAAVLEAVLQNFPYGSLKMLTFRRCQARGRTPRKDMRGEQGFIGVDIADAGHTALVKQE